MNQSKGEERPLHYDFAQDAWIDVPFIMLHPGGREQPLPAIDPAPGRWHSQKIPSFPPSPWSMSKRNRNIVFAALIVMLILAAGAAPHLGLRVLVPFVATEIMLLGLAVAQRCSYRLAQPIATPEDIGLLENSDDPDICLVEVKIFRNGRLTGRDRGAVWFEGGRLLFSGHGTSFAIGGEDVVPRSQREKRDPIEHGSLPLRVRWGSASVTFQTLRDKTRRGIHEKPFHRRLDDFRFFTPLSRGPRQWPPLPPT